MKHRCPWPLRIARRISCTLKRAQKLRKKILSGAFIVALIFILSSMERLKLTSGTPEETISILQKDLTVNQPPPPSLSPLLFVEVCQLHTQHTKVAFFRSTNYETGVYLSWHEKSVNTVQRLLDTNAGQRMKNVSFVQPTWASRVIFYNFLKLRFVNKKPVRTEGIILSHFEIGNLRIRVWFGVVKDLVVNVLLGTSFMDRYA